MINFKYHFKDMIAQYLFAIYLFAIIILNLINLMFLSHFLRAPILIIIFIAPFNSYLIDFLSK
jgi:hypothetical protein